MSSTRIGIGFIISAVLVTTAAAQPESAAMTSAERKELNLLLLERNGLYSRLDTLRRQRGSASDSATKWVQNTLDIVELRLAKLTYPHALSVPPPVFTVETSFRSPADAGTVAPGTAQRLSPQRRVEFSKLLHERNRLHAELTRLDQHAADLIKSGRDAVVTHAEQISVQDQLDLIELRLAILSTRYGLPVPPRPGEEAARHGEGIVPEDEADRNAQLAFARGRERALQQLRREAEEFLASLDFRAFLSN